VAGAPHTINMGILSRNCQWLASFSAPTNPYRLINELN
jgi:hypothetical protein